MDARISALVSNSNELEFNVIQFEKKLMQLKDSQESINSLSAWCLENRVHHKKIVNAWLNVLKKVKVEHRLTLFYLANDVIQYSKRKNYDFVESWGTTLQKATTMVREEKVKNRILRIFKIWEQRGIYGEEFITDLSGLISASPTNRKLDQESQDFQPSYLINRLRSCAKLESDTDLKLKVLKDSNLKIIESETLCASLKDRKHVEDVENEVDKANKLIEGYVNALKAEIKSRTHLIACLAQADTFYNTERKEVKVVVSAYKNFTTRVKNLQKKLNELIPTLGSPIPSPDVNAPSPEPDSDIELPNSEGKGLHDDKIKCNIASGVNVYSMTETYNANYYTPASTQNQDAFSNNGFSSFMGTNLPFNLQNFNTSNLFSEQNHTETYSTTSHDVHSAPHLIPEPVSQPMGQSYDNSRQTASQSVNYNSSVQTPQLGVYPSQQSVYNPPVTQPLLPPPMPPFTTAGYMDSAAYTDPTYAPTIDSYTSNSTYEAVGSTPYAVSSEIQSGYVPSTDAYNPEEELETWEPEASWDAPPDMETPESPPMFEKEGFADPIEYDDSKSGLTGIGKDVDHRILIPPPEIPADISDISILGSDTDHRMNRLSGGKDVDHRNLISLTGSPRSDQPTTSGHLQPPPAPPALWTTHSDRDYRNNISAMQDQDYRVPVDIAQQLQLPPPPPPPPKSSPYKRSHGNHDNVESIDMELSDDENTTNDGAVNNNVAKRSRSFDNNKVLVRDEEASAQVSQNLSENNESENSETVDSDNNENGSVKQNDNMDTIELPPIPQMCELNAALAEDWFEGRPVSEYDRFTPILPDPGRHKNEFRSGYRGRGRGAFSTDDGFRGRAPRIRGGMRTRPFRGGFNNRGRGFRGQFRGGF